MSDKNSLINKIALNDFNYYQYSGGFKNETKETIKLIKTIMSQMSYDELESSNVYLDLKTHCYYSFKSYCPYCGEDYDLEEFTNLDEAKAFNEIAKEVCEECLYSKYNN